MNNNNLKINNEKIIPKNLPKYKTMNKNKENNKIINKNDDNEKNKKTKIINIVNLNKFI